MKKILLGSIFLLLGLTLQLPLPVFAADGNASGDGKFGEITGGECDTIGIACGEGGDIESGEPIIGYIKKIVSIVLSFVGILAIVAIIGGGLMYILSFGDEGRAHRAKLIILYAVIGLIVVGLSAVAVNFLLTNLTEGKGGK